jgi:hypothetical protein
VPADFANLHRFFLLICENLRNLPGFRRKRGKKLFYSIFRTLSPKTVSFYAETLLCPAKKSHLPADRNHFPSLVEDLSAVKNHFSSLLNDLSALENELSPLGNDLSALGNHFYSLENDFPANRNGFSWEINDQDLRKTPKKRRFFNLAGQKETVGRDGSSSDRCRSPLFGRRKRQTLRTHPLKA